MTEKENGQNVTQLTDEEIESVNGGDGLLSINEDLGNIGWFCSTIEIDGDGKVLINGEARGEVVKPIEYVRCIKCNRAMGVRQPGEKATGFCVRCVKKYKYNIK